MFRGDLISGSGTYIMVDRNAFSARNSASKAPYLEFIKKSFLLVCADLEASTTVKYNKN